MEKFKALGIIDPILKSIKEQGIDTPTEIQIKTIPKILSGVDVIAGSSTGSGKTLAFGSGIIQNCEKKKVIQSLVLTPTRELAEQVADSLKKFAKYKNLEITAVYGGVSISPQMERLRIADIVVGTPGRILDHIERRTINLSKVKILVLDEADRMLDMGFKKDVEDIINQCTEKRQTLLFSATISREISGLARRYMNNPVEISAAQHVDPTKLKQVYYDTDNKMKFSVLLHLLKQEHKGLVMVFCNTRHITDFVANNLEGAGIESVAIHGGLSQDKRKNILKSFNNNKVFVMVCTDVAARGLDIKGVSHVYNYDIPKDDKEYIHRIGRTARAGTEGKAISILSQMDHDNFSRILRNRALNVVRETTPACEKAELTFVPKRGGGDRQGGGRGGFGQKRSFGGSRDGGGFGPKRSFGASRDGGERKSYGRDREGSGGFGERKSYGNREGGSGFGARKSYGNREGSQSSGFGGERKSYGNREGSSSSSGGFGENREKKRFVRRTPQR